MITNHQQPPIPPGLPLCGSHLLERQLSRHHCQHPGDDRGDYDDGGDDDDGDNDDDDGDDGDDDDGDDGCDDDGFLAR